MSPVSLPRRSVLLGGAALAAAPIAAHAGDGRGPWSVELFTSQGCSSCPPADANLGELAKRPDIVALSFHVNYWDYIGWKDPFASHDTTERQRAYARSLRQRYVYTPEMVVDGMAHDPGRDLGPIRRLLAEAKRRSPRRATPELTRDGNGPVTVRLAGFAVDGGKADVTIAVYDRRLTTKVGSGENRGHALDNFNVVRHLQLLGQWDGAPASWTVPDHGFSPGRGIAVLVQRPDCGPMLGCNKLDFTVSG